MYLLQPYGAKDRRSLKEREHAQEREKAVREASPNKAAEAVVDPIVIKKKHIVQLAAQHTSCAGCIAAVKSLISSPERCVH
jgi:hypothetical protein